MTTPRARHHHRRRRRRFTGRGNQLRLLLEVMRRLTTDEWTVDELTEDLGIHRRTVWRIIAALRATCALECSRQDHGRASWYRLPRHPWADAAPLAPSRRQ